MNGSHGSSTADSSFGMTSNCLTTYKETQRISPHITAHKSLVPMTTIQSSTLQSSLLNLSGTPASSSNSALTAEFPTYKVMSAGINNGNSNIQEINPSTIAKISPADYVTVVQKERSPIARVMSSCVRTTLTNLARVNPEDLSTTSDGKVNPTSSSSSVSANEYSISLSPHKIQQNLYTLAGQVPASFLPNVLDRNGAFFRGSDSPNLTGQPQAILVSGLVTCSDAGIEHTSNPTTLSALPPSSTFVGEVLGLVNEHRIKKEEDVMSVRPAAVVQQQLMSMPQQNVTASQQHRDLVRQALQAAVENGAPKTNEQELIEYSYSAGDIQDLLMLNLANGTSSIQQGLRQSSNTASNSFHVSHLSSAVSSPTSASNVTTIAGLNMIDATTGASVIMMPTSCSSHSHSDLLTSSSGGGSLLTSDLASHPSHFIQANVDGASSIIMATANSSSNHVDALIAPGTIFGSVNLMEINSQNGVNVQTLNNLNVGESLANSARSSLSSSGGGSPSKNRRNKSTKMSETDLSLKRMKLAQVMREKRASETEDQKKKRRLREAERMRRRRAMESEEQKAQRRLEAAERARLRRATMNETDRILDRRKAAERMRQRRLNEGETQKQIRRMRAAERMRKRRAEETPEQRSFRRRSLANMMRTRRHKKQREAVSNCSASNSLSDDTYKNDLIPVRHLEDLSADLEEVKAQDLSSTMHLDSQVPMHSPGLLLKDDDDHRVDYNDVLMMNSKYGGDPRDRKLIVMDGTDSSKLSNCESHLLPLGLTTTNSVSVANGLQRRIPATTSPGNDAPHFSSRVEYADTSFRTSSPQISSVVLPQYSRLTHSNAPSSPVPSSSPESLSHHISLTSLQHSQDRLYSASTVFPTATSSISSHVPVLRSVSSSGSGILYAQKSSHASSNVSTNIVYTQGCLPAILSSSQFDEAENLSNTVTELTPVDSSVQDTDLGSSRCIPASILSSSAIIMNESNGSGNNSLISTGNTNNVSTSVFNSRSILKLQNSSSPTSSSTFNVTNYCVHDDLGNSDGSPDTSLRQYQLKSSITSPVVMLASSRSSPGRTMPQRVNSSKINISSTPISGHELRNSDFARSHSDLTVNTAASTTANYSSTRNMNRVTNASYANSNTTSVYSSTANNSSSSTGDPTTTGHSSVISSPSTLTTIVLNQSVPSQRSLAS
ncbi:uncharacterized protein LOC108678145 [Hyalella azteca]|uniref:Uncharacterized protein LOC108678145 n=1 Tax=Hyalella azteca TaxID=294128 RepID=A0A8B7P7Q2_HYAAZ|nr:uncharacterized protein LOC108678145 [Hyalella azteca]